MMKIGRMYTHYSNFSDYNKDMQKKKIIFFHVSLNYLFISVEK